MIYACRDIGLLYLLLAGLSYLEDSLYSLLSNLHRAYQASIMHKAQPEGYVYSALALQHRKVFAVLG